jgi:predicted Ser/Thr protein kinase
VTLREGYKLKDYTIGKVIGQGGLGVVYQGTDNLGRVFAIKVLHDKYADDPAQKARFLREASAAAKLSHENVVRLQQVGVDRSHLFIASEYINGKTLRCVMTEGLLTIDRILAIAHDIAAGLSAAHSQGITHRDVKPENIIIDEYGKAKLLDFGLAKFNEQQMTILRSAQLPHVHTDTGSVVGTVSYMSPEQTRGSDVAATSDVWSFGVLCYEMLTQRLPFTGDTAVSVIEAIRENKPVPIRRSVNDCPGELARLVETCLRKNPSDRFKDGLEVLPHLAQIVAARTKTDEPTRKLPTQTLLTRFSKAFQLSNWRALLEILLVPSFLTFIYFNIRFAGLVTLFVGLVLLAYLIFRARRRKSKLLRRYCIAGVLIVTGVLSISFSSTLDHVLLKFLYGTTIYPQGQIRQITENNTKDANGPWPVIVTNSSNQSTLSTTNEAQVLDELFTKAPGKFVFLSGTAGTGKSRLLRKWSYLLSRDRLDYVFFINLPMADVGGLSSSEPIVNLLSAHSEYGKVIRSNPQEYYRKILDSQPALVVLDGLDEIDRDAAARLVTAAYTLASKGQTTILVGGRPESIFLADFYLRDLQYPNKKVVFLSITDTDRRAWDAYFAYRKEAYSLDSLALDRIKEILKRNVAQELAHELDYLDLILRYRDQIFTSDDYALVKFAVDKRVERNNWKEVDAENKISSFCQIAYDMSSHDQFDTKNQDLYLSGFVDINRANAKYQFSPRIIQSYFAVTAFERQLDKGDNPAKLVLSKTLLEDIQKFPVVLERRRKALKASFSANTQIYLHSFDPNSLTLIAKAINDDALTMQIFSKYVSRDFIESQILSKPNPQVR